MVNMASKPNAGRTRPNERSAFELRPIRSARAPTGAAEAAALPISKQVCAERVCVVTQNLCAFSAAVLLRGQGRFARVTHLIRCQPRLQGENLSPRSSTLATLFECIPCVRWRANGRNPASASKPFLRKRRPLGEFIFSKPNSGVVNRRLTWLWLLPHSSRFFARG